MGAPMDEHLRSRLLAAVVVGIQLGAAGCAKRDLAATDLGDASLTAFAPSTLVADASEPDASAIDAAEPAIDAAGTPDGTPLRQSVAGIASHDPNNCHTSLRALKSAPGIDFGRSNCGAPGHPLNGGTMGDVALGAATLGAGPQVTNADRSLARQRARFRVSYRKALATDPTQEGKVVLLIAVAADGSVSGASVVSNAGLAASTAASFVLAARSATFDPPGAPATVQVTLSCTKQD
jgi:hypothetical protein